VTVLERDLGLADAVGTRVPIPSDWPEIEELLR
jgi:hypothetical protein